VHTYTRSQTPSTRIRGPGWRIHGCVEDTKLSTNKQHTLSTILLYLNCSEITPDLRKISSEELIFRPVPDITLTKNENSYPRISQIAQFHYEPLLLFSAPYIKLSIHIVQINRANTPEHAPFHKSTKNIELKANKDHYPV